MCIEWSTNLLGKIEVGFFYVFALVWSSCGRADVIYTSHTLVCEVRAPLWAVVHLYVDQSEHGHIIAGEEFDDCVGGWVGFA